MKFWQAFLTLLTIMLLFLAFTACMPISDANFRPLVTASPTTGVAAQQDAEAYARQFGISKDEALQQVGAQDEIGELNATLEREQAETFAGLWIQHDPVFRLVLAFTRDGKQILQPYLNHKSWGDQVEVRTFPHSLADLKTAQQKVSQAAETLGIPISSSISVMDNRVTVQVGNPDLFRKAVRAAGQTLPDLVDIVANDPNHLTDTLRSQVDTYWGPEGQTIYFPKQAPTNVSLTALMEGTLILDSNGCLRVKVERGDTPLVLWRYGFTLQVDGDRVEVHNDKGQLVARVGEPVRMGGGSAPNPVDDGLSIATCPGPFWALGDIEPLTAQAIPDIIVQPLQIRQGDPANSLINSFLLQQSRPAPEEGSLTGLLTVDQDGCLRVDGYTVLWPPDVWPRDDPDRLRFVRLDGSRETTVAALGRDVWLSGSQRQPEDYRYFENKVPCSGPYWGVATIKER